MFPVESTVLCRPVVRLLMCLTSLALAGHPVSAQTAVATPEVAPVAIHTYVQKPEPEFQWKLLKKQELAGAKVFELRVTSQRWHDILWEHAVEVIEPENLVHPKHVLLFVTGGSQPPKVASERDLKMGLQLAAVAGMRVAVLHQVPNQPLYDGRVEDDLITETWLRYLQTGDESWPLLFPMVKSAIKTMDAVQQLSQQEFEQPVDSFIITGASKRGWTSWLTPVADRRIIATAPIVIDVLNFRAQMKHQKDTWGKYSEQIIDYTSKGLIVEGDENMRERQLRLMMDPYNYRSQLTLPKLLVNGTNDPYWVVDAMKLYWDDLQGPKYALFLPNADRDLDDGREKALVTIATFARLNAAGAELPELKWTFTRDNEQRNATITSSQTPVDAVLWTAQSPDLDFRNDSWTSSPMQQSEDGSWQGHVMGTSDHHVAMYVELQFQTDGITYSLCSLVRRD